MSHQENICEECEDQQASFNCQECGQILCISCDKQIHNKGKRVYHTRNPYHSTQSLPNSLNQNNNLNVIQSSGNNNSSNSSYNNFNGLEEQSQQNQVKKNNNNQQQQQQQQQQNNLNQQQNSQSSKNNNPTQSLNLKSQKIPNANKQQIRTSNASQHSNNSQSQNQQQQQTRKSLTNSNVSQEELQNDNYNNINLNLQNQFNSQNQANSSSSNQNTPNSSRKNKQIIQKQQQQQQIHKNEEINQNSNYFTGNNKANHKNKQGFKNQNKIDKNGQNQQQNDDFQQQNSQFQPFDNKNQKNLNNLQQQNNNNNQNSESNIFNNMLFINNEQIESKIDSQREKQNILINQQNINNNYKNNNNMLSPYLLNVENEQIPENQLFFDKNKINDNINRVHSEEIFSTNNSLVSNSKPHFQNSFDNKDNNDTKNTIINNQNCSNNIGKNNNNLCVKNNNMMSNSLNNKNNYQQQQQIGNTQNISDMLTYSTKKSPAGTGEVIQSVSFIDVSMDRGGVDNSIEYNKYNQGYFLNQFQSQKNNSNQNININNNNQNQPTNQPIAPVKIPIIQQFFIQIENDYEEFAKQILIENANKGELLIKLDIFKEQLQEKYPDIDDIENILNKLDGKLVHNTTRKFGESEPIHYISLKLDQISFQSINWILKSIRNDGMTPKESLVLSRIKESYALKLNQSLWNGILVYMKQLAFKNDTSNNEKGIIEFDENQIDKIIILKNQDIQNNVEQLSIYIEDGQDWKLEDIGPLVPEDRTLWKVFINYLQEFFKDQNQNGNNSFYDYQNQLNGQDQEENSNLNNSAYETPQSNKNNSNNTNSNWTSSVETVLTKGTKKPLVKPPKSISKAIPGGRYGCAQLLKCCGPKDLKQCSMGKLSLFVQEAINKGILSYYRTLLIKPNNIDFNDVYDINFQDSSVNISQNNEDRMSKQQLDKVGKLKSIIIDILKSNREGVSLAKLPKLIKKRINFTFDLHELGFPKLKSFLQIIEGVEIDKDSSTKSQAIYRPAHNNINNNNSFQNQNNHSFTQNQHNNSNKNNSNNNTVPTNNNISTSNTNSNSNNQIKNSSSNSNININSNSFYQQQQQQQQTGQYQNLLNNNFLGNNNLLQQQIHQQQFQQLQNLNNSFQNQNLNNSFQNQNLNNSFQNQNLNNSFQNGSFQNQNNSFQNNNNQMNNSLQNLNNSFTNQNNNNQNNILENLYQPSQHQNQQKIMEFQNLLQPPSTHKQNQTQPQPQPQPQFLHGQQQQNQQQLQQQQQQLQQPGQQNQSDWQFQNQQMNFNFYNNNENEQNQNKEQRNLSPVSYNKRFCTLKAEQLNSGTINNFNGRTLSNIDDYQSKVHQYLEEIINQHQHVGIMSQKLYELLSQKLGGKFEISLFNCKTFNEFLSKNTENYTDIMIKQENYIIYPKNYNMQQNFFQFNKQRQQQQQQQLQSNQQQLPFNQQQQQLQNNPLQQQQLNKNNPQHQQTLSQHQYSQSISFQPQTENLNQSTSLFQAECSSIGNNSYNNSYVKTPFNFQEESQNELQDQYRFIEELLQEGDSGSYDPKLKKPKSTDFYSKIQQRKQQQLNNPQLSSGNFNHMRKYSPLYFNNNLPEINEEQQQQQLVHPQQKSGETNNKSFSVNEDKNKINQMQNQKKSKTKTVNFQ